MKPPVRVAIVGAGPAGKSAARLLLAAGFAVTLFEAEPEGGGLLRYGYPESRMPARTSQRDTSRLQALGAEFRFGERLGETIALSDLAENYDAVLLAIGASRSRRLKVPGETLPGIHLAREFLYAARTKSPLSVGSRVAVIGGGDTAVDVSTTALDQGAEQVTIYHRGATDELRAQEREVAMARGAGVRLVAETSVREITVSEGALQLAWHDDTPPVVVDTIIVAIGQEIDVEAWAKFGLSVKADGSTSWPTVFVAGESLYGADLLARAILGGREAGQHLVDFLS